MPRIIINIRQEDVERLLTIAEHEYRDPRAQATLLLREALERRGLLRPTDPAAPDLPADGDEVRR